MACKVPLVVVPELQLKRPWTSWLEALRRIQRVSPWPTATPEILSATVTSIVTVTHDSDVSICDGVTTALLTVGALTSAVVAVVGRSRQMATATI